jgi:hypothetical protein
LGSRFALPVGGALSAAVLNEKYSHVRKFTEIRITRRWQVFSADLAPTNQVKTAHRVSNT